MTLQEKKDKVISKLTITRDLCIKSESYEEVTDLENLMKRTEIATNKEELIQIVMEAMVYNRMAMNSYIKRGGK